MDRLAAVDWFTIIAALCFWQALVWAQHLDRGFPALAQPAHRAWPVALGGRWLWSSANGEPGLSSWLWLPRRRSFFALWLWAHGLRRFLADDLAPAPRRYLEMLSATGPLVAAAAWIWSRYDRTFAGFPDPLATLTTVHFAITFGVLPLAMAASERPLARCRWRDLGLSGLYVAGAPATALCFALRTDPLRPGCRRSRGRRGLRRGLLALGRRSCPSGAVRGLTSASSPASSSASATPPRTPSAGTISPSRRWRRCTARSTCSARVVARGSSAGVRGRRRAGAGLLDTPVEGGDRATATVRRFASGRGRRLGRRKPLPGSEGSSARLPLLSCFT